MVTNARIVFLPGDGIGPEVLAAAQKVLMKVAAVGGLSLEVQQGFIGGSSYEHCGEPLEAETLKLCREADAVLLGAVGGPRWDKLAGSARPEAGLLRLRKELGVFANIRPVKARASLYGRTPYRQEVLENVDLVIVRELTGGIYFGEKSRTADRAQDLCVYTREEIERITRVAADLAMSRRKKLTSIDKANVLETSRLWRSVVSEVVEKDYPGLKLEHILVDAAAMYLAQKPDSFDVIVTENMFGDILSDQASTLAGSLGLLPSASLSAGGPGLYEPVHGSAPDIAGKGIANPLGAILSVAMLLRSSLKAESLAQKVEAAVEQVLAQGDLTPDLSGNKGLTTHELSERICALIH